MKEFTITQSDDGKKLEKWLIREMPTVTMGMRKKYFRLKRYKLNGRPAKEDARLAAGDLLSIYLNDEEFAKPKHENPFLSKIHPKLSIVYEDDNLIIIDKQVGLQCHPDENEKVKTLVAYIQAYLYQKEEYDPDDPTSFAPVLCNRIDRFTTGLVIAAKTRTAMQVINQKIRSREIDKYYYCVCFNRFKKQSGLMENYIIKSPGMKKVEVTNKPVPNGQQALTQYQVVAAKSELNLVECKLLTGRTHQIRASMAHAGHPLLGDNQYGDKSGNQRYKENSQLLCSYRLQFSFLNDASELNYLNGMSFSVKHVSFIEKYFPDFVLK